MMQNYCAAPNCPVGISGDTPLFRFPRDPERCQKWVENSHCEDLKEKSHDHLYRYCRLCVKHFDASSIEKNDSLNTRLKSDAIPTVFDVSSQSENGQLKRKKSPAKGNETERNMKKKTTKNQKDKKGPDTQAVSEEDEYKEYLKSLFEVVVLLGVQNIPVKAPPADKEESLASSNFLALLDYRMNTGDEVLKKRYGGLSENKECSQSSQLSQLIEVCEKCIRDELLKEVRQNTLFSLVTDDLVKISEEWYLPVFLRYVDQTNCWQEKLAGLLPFEGDEEALAEWLLAELTDKWGLNMEHCRGQAHSCSGSHFKKIKAFATKLSQKYPMAVLTPRSVCALTVSLANSMALSGVQLVLSTFRKITSFFSQSLSLQLELEHAISIFYSDKEDKANELKEVSRNAWTTRHDAFEVAVDLIESLLLCVDSVHDNEEMRWGDKITHDALQISRVLADFEFVMSLVVLKNTLSLTRAFGKNVQGEAADAYSASNSLKAVLHSLTEVLDNIDVYHEFWFDEAVSLAAALEIQVKIPWSVLKHRSGSRTGVQPESFYKQHLTIPVVEHVIREMNDLFCETHLKALRCLSLVPTILGQNKSAEPETENLQMYKDDIPNAGTLSAELHCWWVKWSHRNKGDVMPCTLQNTLQLADVKFFPNVLAVLKVIGTLPTFVLENKSDVSYQRFKMYMENTPESCRSKSLALFYVNSDTSCDLDAMVEAYMTTYPEKET